MRRINCIAIGVLTGIILSFEFRCGAQPTEQVIKSFGIMSQAAANPRASLLLTTNGLLYGTTENGGSGGGTIFSISTNGTSFNVLHTFAQSGSEGQHPCSSLALGPDGFFYGTTRVGGVVTNNGFLGSGAGTVFNLSPDGTGCSVLYAFNPNYAGRYAFAGLVVTPDGNLYGTTSDALFKIHNDGTGFVTLPCPGSRVQGGFSGSGAPFIIGPDGFLYVIASVGEAGAVVKLLGDGSSGAVLHSFSGFDGLNPFRIHPAGYSAANALVLGGDGVLYGVTIAGGTNSAGTIFRLATDGSGFATLHAFTHNDGDSPYGALIQGKDGALYGTAGFGGFYNNGTVFKILTNGLGYTILHSFNGNDGQNPFAGLTQSGDGTLFGTTYSGGSGGQGTIFSIQPDGSGYTVLHSFYAAGGDGQFPYADLVQATNGLFYGTTFAGGNDNVGTVFQVSSTGDNYRLLHSFAQTGQDGQSPHSALLQASNGVLFGTTLGGGSNGLGTVFRMQPDGTGFSICHHFGDFSGDGQSPIAGLIQATNRYLYGTCSAGGTNGLGALFRVNLDGSDYSILHSFSFQNNDGQLPFAVLTQGADGALYGTTQLGGTNQAGTVFKINLDGSGYSILHSFDLSAGDAQNAYGALLCASNGVLYGTAYGSFGSTIRGTIFKINNDGSGYGILHTFGNSTGDGWFPASRLTQGSDGALYGTTQYGGSYVSPIFGGGLVNFGYGTLFSINPDGTGYTTLYSFNLNGDGTYPYAGVVLGNDGALYGTATYSGDTGNGALFRWGTNATVSSPSIRTLAQSRGTMKIVWNVTPNRTFQVQCASDLNHPNWCNFGDVVASTNSMLITLDQMTNGQRFYRLILVH